MSKVALIILDGWGLGNKSKSDAIYQAKTPNFDKLYTPKNSATLLTHGENVGLPNGQMGNSEVGHLNIGAGRVVYQDLVKVNKAVESRSFFKEPTLLEAFTKAKTNKVNIHFIGLVSNGGVHSHQNHLIALCEMAKQQGVKGYIHAFTDGRDTDPNSGLGFCTVVENAIAETPVKFASIIGRYYAMDRDKRWERVAKAYNLLTKGEGESFQSVQDVFEKNYTNKVTDEFIEPALLDSEGTIKPNDVVICFNFRTDRCREITEALTQQNFPEEGMKTLPLHYYTMTNYDKTFKNVNVVYDKDNLKNTLGEVLSSNRKTQVRIAETEKYPHVTFFFSGGREAQFDGEERLMVNSPKVATYDLQPEMSAHEVTASICENIENKQPDFVCLNFANPDMVGHTGVYSAIIKAVETIDTCFNTVAETALKNKYKVVVIADHGNADNALNEDGSANTAHSINPVPVILLGSDRSLQNGILADVAPTILDLMEVPQPKEMTGKSLLQ